MEVVLVVGVGVVSVVVASVEVVSAVLVIVISFVVVGHSWSVPVVPGSKRGRARARTWNGREMDRDGIFVRSWVPMHRGKDLNWNYRAMERSVV